MEMQKKPWAIVEVGAIETIARVDEVPKIFFKLYSLQIQIQPVIVVVGDRPAVANSLFACSYAKSGINLCNNDWVSVKTFGLFTPI